MDINQQQIGSEEQKTVLKTLAENAARLGCSFLEIGSWCGDSSVILGKVAQRNSGHLYCVDWWRGNVGTELNDIASQVDIFSVFWRHICDEGLEEVVIPIRGRSDIVAKVLRDKSFDLIFVDGDHRYEAALSDLNLYAPLVNQNNGIFCGHDCEGRISDYEADFLESGKSIDFFESVHCGAVMAVGSVFQSYSVNHAIWSVMATGQNTWEATNLSYPGIKIMRQPPAPPTGFSENHILFRYGREVFAVLRSRMAGIALDESNIEKHAAFKAKTIREIEVKLGEKVFASDQTPVLIETYRKYNIVKYWKYYAIAISLGPVNLTSITTSKLLEYTNNNKLFIGDSIENVKRDVENKGLSRTNHYFEMFMIKYFKAQVL